MKVDMNIATLNTILETLESQGVILVGKAFDELHEMYGRELSQMIQHAQGAKEPMIYLAKPNICGTQVIIEFAIFDKSISKEDKVNWHGQNTSQWLYAGALVYDQNDGTWSAHH